MKTLKTILAATCLLFCMTATADDYAYLTIDRTEGEVSYTVNNIQKITFDSTDMIVSMTDGTSQRLPLSGLSKMFFASSPSAINAVGASAPKFSVSDGVLRVNMARGEHFTLYNMKGEAVYSSSVSCTVDLKTLRGGVYIARTGSETIKVMSR